MSKLSARLADFLRASAALLESAFLGLGLPKRPVVPTTEPNSCCQYLWNSWWFRDPRSWSQPDVKTIQVTGVQVLSRCDSSLNNFQNQKKLDYTSNFSWHATEIPASISATYLFNFISSQDTSHKDWWFVQIIWKRTKLEICLPNLRIWTCLHI